MPDLNTLQAVVGIAGQGKIHQMIQSYLAQIYHTVAITVESPASELSSCSLIISCSDSWSPETLQLLNQRCIRLGVALLPIYTYFNVGIIGPCVIPNVAGCIICADQRKLGATWDDSECELLYQHSASSHGLALHQSWLTTWNIEVLSQLTLTEIDVYLNAPEQLRTRQALVYLMLNDLQSSLHHFLPVSDCPECGSMQPDTAEQATIILQSQAKPGPFSYHTRNLGAYINELLTTYVDLHCGVIGGVTPRPPCVQPHAFTFARSRPSRHAHWRLIPAMGVATRWDQSMAVAIAESLERHAGQYPHKKRTEMHASYQQLDVQAFDPTALGLHSPSQYTQSGFNYVPYSQNLVTDWVWGYSFQKQRALLIPECCAYYGNYKQGEAFVYEISNGCALGGNIEEAILYGILEVAERDAFLMTWYAQLALTRLDLMSVTDPSLRVLIKRMEQISGYTLMAFNATLDHAVPCLWVMAVDEQQRPDTPRVFCVGGSHPHPERALSKALQELGASLIPQVDAETFLHERERLLKMFHDPYQVQQMEDHVRLYWLPEAFDRLNFIYHAPHYQSFQEAFHDFYRQPPQSLDLRDDLNAIVEHYLRRGIDILVIDQTTPEQELHGLHCVKILMPGTLSMTFGHMYRRTTDCERLYRLPHTLGYQEHLLTEADLNPHPHPFP